MSTQSRWNRLLALALVLPLAACAGEEEPEVGVDDDAFEVEPAPTTGADMGMEPMTISLEPLNESGVTGEVRATHRMDSVTVEVSVQGAPEGELPAHIHSGTCDSVGGVVAPLSPVQGGQSTTTLASSQVGENQETVVQVHDPSGQPIACAEMRGHGDMGTTGTGTMGDTVRR